MDGFVERIVIFGNAGAYAPAFLCLKMFEGTGTIFRFLSSINCFVDCGEGMCCWIPA